MAYDKERLFTLPVEEKLELVVALWDQIDNELMPVTKDEILFAQDRLDLHKENPGEQLSWEELREKVEELYGF